MSDDRDDEGRLLPGHALKSPGRPRGLSMAERIAQHIEPHRQEILDKAIALAKAGDPASMKLVLERLAPIPRQDAERVSIPGFAEAGTLQDKATAVMQAAATGHCSAEAAERLLRVLDIYAKAIVADEHERRLQALERGRAAPRAVEVLPASAVGSADFEDLA